MNRCRLYLRTMDTRRPWEGRLAPDVESHKHPRLTLFFTVAVFVPETGTKKAQSRHGLEVLYQMQRSCRPAWRLEDYFVRFGRTFGPSPSDDLWEAV